MKVGKIDDIQRLEHYVIDYESKPIEKGRILFIGSSGFTRWQKSWGNPSLEDDIRAKDGSVVALNHGFGGSTAEEVLYYYDRLVKPYEPRAIVLRVYPNDRGFGYTPEEILELIIKILDKARADFNGVKLYICDAPMFKKNIGNVDSRDNALRFNSILLDYCNSHDDCTYICHSSFPEFFEAGEDIGDYFKVRQDIFIEDNLHFNSEGYKIYKNMFLQALDDIL